VLDIVYFLKALKYYWEKNRPIVYNRWILIILPTLTTDKI
jgi:hypothetical protein